MARTVASTTSTTQPSKENGDEIIHSMITPTTYLSTNPTATPNIKRTRMTRYSWDATEKTFTLIRLLTTVLENKGNVERRYVSGTDWDLVYLAYNEAMPDTPVSNVFALKNRLALLKLQFKDYQKVVEAKKSTPEEELDQKAWQALISKYPETAKWRFTTFEYYDKLLEYFKLAGMEDGELLSAPVGRPRLDRYKTVSKEKKTLVSNQATAMIVTPSRSPSITIRANSTTSATIEDGDNPVSVKALVAAVAELEQQSQLRKRRAQEGHEPHTKLTPNKQSRLENSKSDHVNTMEIATSTKYSKDNQIVHQENTPYEKALEALAKLDLPLSDRVDAKLFLSVSRYQTAFVHMEKDEQKILLEKYCFNARNENGCWQEQ